MDISEVTFATSIGKHLPELMEAVKALPEGCFRSPKRIMPKGNEEYLESKELMVAMGRDLDILVFPASDRYCAREIIPPQGATNVSTPRNELALVFRLGGRTYKLYQKNLFQ
jgi:hypothetical protein